MVSLTCTSPFFKILGFFPSRIKIMLNEENLESLETKEAKGVEIIYNPMAQSQSLGTVWLFVFPLSIFWCFLCLKTIVEYSVFILNSRNSIPISLTYELQCGRRYLRSSAFCSELTQCFSYWVVSVFVITRVESLMLDSEKNPSVWLNTLQLPCS